MASSYCECVLLTSILAHPSFSKKIKRLYEKKVKIRLPHTCYWQDGELPVDIAPQLEMLRLIKSSAEQKEKICLDGSDAVLRCIGRYECSNSCITVMVRQLSPIIMPVPMVTMAMIVTLITSCMVVMFVTIVVTVMTVVVICCYRVDKERYSIFQ